MKNKIYRLLWSICQNIIFKYSPRNFYSWRNLILRIFGANIHRTVRFKRTCKIENPKNLNIGRNSYFGDFVHIYNLGSIEIGEDVIISQKTFLCDGTHDYISENFELIVKSIVVESNVWIGADVFIGPGVKIGKDCVIGAKAVVLKEMPENFVCVGFPCKPLKIRYEK